MFKLIFRTITLSIILIILTIVLAIWKGGEPFRWVGDKTVSIGRTIGKFGDMIDGMKETKRKAVKALKEMKETVMPKKDDSTEEEPKSKDAGIDKRKRPK
ncbi:MAG: hypothetical protein HY756_00040 [Nitrospirae bacterium]|nr:hypothetical protein [Nitrospirota bacterium]